MRTSRPSTVRRVPVARFMAATLLATTLLLPTLLSPTWAMAQSTDEAPVTWDDMGLDPLQERFLVLMEQGLIPVVGWDAYGVVEGGEIPAGSDDVNVTRAAQVLMPAVSVEDFMDFLVLSSTLSYLPTDLVRFQAATGVVVTAVEVDVDVTECANRQIEISIWRLIGLQAFAGVPGFRTPDAGMSEGIAFLCRLGFQSGIFVWSQDPGRQFTTAYPIGVFPIGDRSILLFATPDPALGRVAVTVATDPDDPDAYGVREGPVELVDAPPRPDEPTPGMVELAIALGWYTPPAVETPPQVDPETPDDAASGGDVDGVAESDAPGDDAEDVGPPVIEGELPPDDPDSGLEWVQVGVPIVVAGVVVAWVMVARQRTRKRYCYIRSTKIGGPSQGPNEYRKPENVVAFADGLIADLKAGGATLNERGRYEFESSNPLIREERLGSEPLGEDLEDLFVKLDLSVTNGEGCLPGKRVIEWFYGGPRGVFEVDPKTREFFETERIPEGGATLSSSSDEVVVM